MIVKENFSKNNYSYINLPRREEIYIDFYSSITNGESKMMVDSQIIEFDLINGKKELKTTI